MKEICAVILGAGQGKRIGASEANLPKVMFEIKGKPMIRYSVDNIKSAGLDDVIVVVGFQKEKIMDYLGQEVQYAFQEELLGTGHAAMMAKDLVLGNYQAVLVCYGDMPLYKPETIQNLIKIYQEKQPTIAMLTNHFEDPNCYGYGRIIRNKENQIIAITEQKDCTEEQTKISECNPGFYIFDANWLYENIEKLKSENAQNEYYLTDMIAMAISQGKNIETVEVADWHEVLGINNLDHLKEVEDYLDAQNK